MALNTASFSDKCRTALFTAGFAGTGKTYMLEEVLEQANKHKVKVIVRKPVCTPAAHHPSPAIPNHIIRPYLYVIIYFIYLNDVCALNGKNTAI
jgi:Cdc6-like AAA superfamily ATPase